MGTVIDKRVARFGLWWLRSGNYNNDNNACNVNNDGNVNNNNVDNSAVGVRGDLK